MEMKTSSVLHGWSEGRCPILNGVFYPDDTVVPLDVEEHEDGSPPDVRARDAVSLNEVAGPVEWTSLGVLAEASVPGLDARVAVGQGGMGGDGFVALLVGAEGKLEWLAFFDCSNPFEEVRVEGRDVLAVSNLGVEWRFPVTHPEAVTANRRFP